MDIDSFKIERNLETRRNLVGYVGRLGFEKGIINLAKSIPLILEVRDDLEFLIAGWGPLSNDIKSELRKTGAHSNAEIVGWIPHDELPGYLNELKLLVLPSYSEGLPGIVQEGMACGTPVLATPVGGVPDLIKDGETGFIMEDNSPESIARNVVRALGHPNLEQIVQNARKLIEQEYTYEIMVGKCRQALERLVEKEKQNEKAKGELD